MSTPRVNEAAERHKANPGPDANMVGHPVCAEPGCNRFIKPIWSRGYADGEIKWIHQGPDR